MKKETLIELKGYVDKMCDDKTLTKDEKIFLLNDWIEKTGSESLSQIQHSNEFKNDIKLIEYFKKKADSLSKPSNI